MCVRCEKYRRSQVVLSLVCISLFAGANALSAFQSSVHPINRAVAVTVGYDGAYNYEWEDEYGGYGSYPSLQEANKHEAEWIKDISRSKIVESITHPQITANCIGDPLSTFGDALISTVVCAIFVVMMIWSLALQVHLCRAANTFENSRALLQCERRPNIDALDGLRALLITYIVCFHLMFLLPEILRPFFKFGHWAVQFFFVLSGFVSSYVTEGQHSRLNYIAGTQFVIRRLVRLYPAYVVALMWLAFLGYKGIFATHPFIGWPASALMIQAMVPLTICGAVEPGQWNRNNLGFSGNGPGWFVSCIVFVSCLFPLLYNSLQCIFHRPDGSRRSIQVPICLMVIVVLARHLPTLAEISRGHKPQNLELGLYDWNTNSFLVYVFAFLRLGEFAAGMCAASVCSHLPGDIWTWRGWGWIFDISLVMALVVKKCVLMSFPHGPPYGDYLLTFVFCVACIGARGASEGLEQSTLDGQSRRFAGGVFSPLLSSWPFVWIAQYSYGAYIFEEPVFHTLRTLLGPRVPAEFMWICLFLGTWIVGGISFHCLELPARKAFEWRMRGGQAKK
eukprot:TRINITY_DN25371_c1_g1_i1.p1 TRINITY_DN25371_c1_g1~~TRINITY_DN25371_c1_g1_i1.p1  ORF type:complete len:563 (+),score=36.11 TRINITY_DN25371_c1_g1_i1:52-1740(+)